ncbi:MAG: YggT family protein [bacterium]|nr:YggT family protein [bacterium]
MDPIVFVLIKIIELFRYLLLAYVIVSWLIAFNVVNTRNQVVAAIADFLFRITEPVLGPIRRWLPNLGGLDISPIVLFFLLLLIELYLQKLL